MKKNLLVVLAFLSMFVIVGCSGDSNSTTEIDYDNDLTDYELISLVRSEIEIPNSNNVTENLIIPRFVRKGLRTVSIEWNPIDHSYINDRGVVFRPLENESDVEVEMRATFYIEGSSSSAFRDFDLVLKKIPETVEGKLEEAVTNLTFVENNEVIFDSVVLPRTGSFASEITWETSDSSIISLDGNVNKTDEEQEVTMTATLNIDGKTEEKSFDVKVLSLEEESEEEITTESKGVLRIVEVENKLTFMQALVNVVPGDLILLNDGIYRDVVTTLTTSGTEENPIYILADNPGRAIFSGTTQLNIFADHVVISSLDFQNGSPDTDKGVIDLNGNYLRVTNTRILNFETYGDDYKWLSMTGKYHEIDRNIFADKTVGGALLTVWRNDNSPQYHRIHKNIFKDFHDAGGANGYETIRVGDSHQSQSDAHIIIEDNLFERLDGEIEIISLKSGRNIVRGNTFLDSAGLVVTRHGKNNVIENNVFLGEGKSNSGGIRAYDGGHVIRNNYIENIVTTSETRGGIVIHSGINIPGEATTMNAQWTSYNMLIEGNTFVDSVQSILVDGKYAHAARDIVIKDNLIVAKSGEAAFRHDKELVNPTFENNMAYSDASFSGGGSIIGTLPNSGLIFTNDLTGLPEINENGLRLNENIGAKGLFELTSSNTGVNWL